MRYSDWHFVITLFGECWGECIVGSKSERRENTWDYFTSLDKRSWGLVLWSGSHGNRGRYILDIFWRWNQ